MINPFKLIGSWTLAVLFLGYYIYEYNPLFLNCSGNGCPNPLIEIPIFFVTGFILGTLGDLMFYITQSKSKASKEKQ